MHSQFVRHGYGASVLVTLLLVAQPAAAVRPFITDDARVVGGKLAQMESWGRVDRGAYQQWVLIAVGPVEPIELTIGGVYGVTYGDDQPKFSVAGPILQAKYLLRKTLPNRLPGVAISIGAVPPVGLGAFRTHGWDAFAYAALSQSFRQDAILLHANLGIFGGGLEHDDRQVKATWGVGTQLQIFGGLHGVAELFSGDPYAKSSGGAVQFGFRYILTDEIQFDGTCGKGIWGEPPIPLWFSAGVRLVTRKLW